MIFIDNKYTRIYYAIIEKAKSRPFSNDVYTERHHIIPQSFYKSRSKTGWLSGDYNSKTNLINLTAKEHYICHLLLTKMTQGISLHKMVYALRRFAHSPKTKQFINSRTYELISKLQSKSMTGRACPPETREKIRQANLKRLPASFETRQKLSQAARLRKGFTPEGKSRVVESNKNRIWTEESKEKLRIARARQVERQGDTMTVAAREKLSRAAKGRKLSKEHIEKIVAANKGKKRSEEIKQAISKQSIGRIKSNETIEKLRNKASKEPKCLITCPHCNKIGGKPSMIRWHLDNCKLNIIMQE